MKTRKCIFTPSFAHTTAALLRAHSHARDDNTYTEQVFTRNPIFCVPPIRDYRDFSRLSQILMEKMTLLRNKKITSNCQRVWIRSSAASRLFIVKSILGT